MNKLIELIEKGKPFFEKISRNKYLRANSGWLYCRDACYPFLIYLHPNCVCTKRLGIPLV